MSLYTKRYFTSSLYGEMATNAVQRKWRRQLTHFRSVCQYGVPNAVLPSVENRTVHMKWACDNAVYTTQYYLNHTMNHKSL